MYEKDVTLFVSQVTPGTAVCPEELFGLHFNLAIAGTGIEPEGSFARSGAELYPWYVEGEALKFLALRVCPMDILDIISY